VRIFLAEFGEFGIDHELAIRLVFISLIVLPMRFFSLVKICERLERSNDWFIIYFLLLEFFDKLFCFFSLFLGRGKNSGTILGSNVIPLPIQCRRIMT